MFCFTPAFLCHNSNRSSDIKNRRRAKISWKKIFFGYIMPDENTKETEIYIMYQGQQSPIWYEKCALGILYSSALDVFGSLKLALL